MLVSYVAGDMGEPNDSVQEYVVLSVANDRGSRDLVFMNHGPEKPVVTPERRLMLDIYVPVYLR